MSLTCTISNIQFDYAFTEAVKRASASIPKKGVTKFDNGIPMQTFLVFKTICCLPDDELNTKVIQEWHFRLFGSSISSTSTVRNLGKLTAYGFLDSVTNPHGSSKYTWVKLSPQGRKLQKLFIGSTSDWKDRPRAVVERQVKTAMNGGIYD
jgi:hypothetical protein